MRVVSALRALFAPLRLPDGRTLPTPKRPAVEHIITVRTQDLWGTYPSTGLTPTTLASILKEADAGAITRAMELAEEVEAKSPRILTGLQTRKRAVQRLDWTVTPASNSTQDVKIAEFVRKNFTDCGLRKPIYHLLDAIYKGFATLWIQWRIDAGQIWLGGLEWTPQTRWTYLPRTVSPSSPAPLTPRLLTEREPIWGEELADERRWNWLIHTDCTRSTVPQRAGLWRTLVWYWMFGVFSLKDWLVFLDRYGLPFKLGKYPSGLDPKEVDVLKAAVQAASDSGAVINDQVMLDIIETKGAGTDMHERLARYCDEQITLAILGQVGTTQGTPGKLGNEEEQGEVRDELMQADAADLAETIQHQLVWPLVGWNFGWEIMLPRFEFVSHTPEDLTAKSATYKTLVEIGVPITVRQAQEAFGIHPPEGDEAVLGGAVPSPRAPREPASRLAAARAEEDPTPATVQADRMETETTPAWVTIMDHIKAIVDTAESLPALREALLTAYSDLPHERLSDIMAMGFAAAELAGRFDAREESRP